jgi:hypothetical protein
MAVRVGSEPKLPLKTRNLLILKAQKTHRTLVSVRSYYDRTPVMASIGGLTKGDSVTTQCCSLQIRSLNRVGRR